jgi:hypothetical protein
VVRRLSLRALLDEAMRLSRRHFRQVYPAVAGPVALAAVAVALLQVALFGGESGMSTPGDEGWVRYFVTLFAVGMVFAVFAGFGNAAMMGAAAALAEQRPVSMLFWWAWVVRPRVLGTMILVGLLVMVGMLVCCIPGIVAGIAFGLVVPVMALEERYGRAALERSWALITYNPSQRLADHPGVKLLVIGLVGGMISYLATMLVQLPFTVVQQVVVMRSVLTAEGAPEGVAGIPPAIWWLQVPQALLGNLASEAVVVFMAFATVLLFLDVRRGKEGQDLEQALDALAAPQVDRR